MRGVHEFRSPEWRLALDIAGQALLGPRGSSQVGVAKADLAQDGTTTRAGTANAVFGESTARSSEGTIAAAGGAPARLPAGGFYISPVLSYDPRSSTVIFQIRDAESGDVTRQFPAEEVVERYRRDPAQAPFVLPEPAAGPGGDALGPVSAASETAAAELGGSIAGGEFGAPLGAAIGNNGGGAPASNAVPASVSAQAAPVVPIPSAPAPSAALAPTSTPASAPVPPQGTTTDIVT